MLRVAGVFLDFAACLRNEVAFIRIYSALDLPMSLVDTRAVRSLRSVRELFCERLTFEHDLVWCLFSCFLGVPLQWGLEDNLLHWELVLVSFI